MRARGTAPGGCPSVVIVGAGFGGLWTARALAGRAVDVLVIDRNNFHTFWPLLYQIGAAEIEATQIAYPVRAILRKYDNVRFAMASVQGLDAERRILRTDDGDVGYDYLVLALGSTAFFFDTPGAEQHSFPLKTLDDGLELRNQILSRFELALAEPDPSRRTELLSFVIVGGGPTGVEFAGALMELITAPLRKDFPELDFEQVSVTLVEAMDTLLPGFDPKVGDYARRRLTRMGVDVRTRTMVREITPSAVRLDDGIEMPGMTVIWTAGVRGHPLAEVWGLPVTKRGTVLVDRTLQVQGHPRIFAIGDLAHFEQDGRPLPMVAPVATQQGEAAAENLLRLARGEPPARFEFEDPGMLATIGRNKAIADIRGHTFTGFLAWLLWVLIHIVKLIGFRNRVIVLIDWAIDYFLYERAVRLILPFQGVRDVVAETRSRRGVEAAGPGEAADDRSGPVRGDASVNRGAGSRADGGETAERQEPGAGGPTG